MARVSLMVLLATAAVLSACERTEKPAGPTAPSGPVTERAGPARWNATTGGFEFNGKPLKTAKLWTFEGSTEGFTAVSSKIVPASDQGLSVQVADPTLRSPKGLNVPGAQYPLVLVRLTRTAAGEGWDGALYYATANHPEASTFFGKPLGAVAPALNETVTLVYDMAHQTVGAPDWTASTIDEIRLDIEDKAGGGFIIRQIAIAESPGPDALGPAPAAPPAPAPAAAPKP